MDEWIDYYDSTHTIYASKLHRDVHFEVIANDIIGYIPSPDAVVLDYACGEALSAARVASACGKLILAEPAPGVRGRLIARFAPNTKIRVRSLDELRGMEERSVDLAVLNSAAQYMTPAELDSAFAVIHRALKPDGVLVLGDILDPRVGMGRDVLALLRFGASHGFLKDALVGLVRTALSDYRQLRSRVGLQHYSEAEMLAKLKAAGYSASRAPKNIGHFGLNLVRYAHFTSPIRRYADLIVHRALIRALSLGPDGLTDEEIQRLAGVAKAISDTERRAMSAERETTDRLIAALSRARNSSIPNGFVT